MREKRKKNKKKHYKRLKWYDKWAYGGLLALGLILYFGLIFGFFAVHRGIALHSAKVTVYKAGPTILTGLVPLFPPAIVGMVFWAMAWLEKKPIFGPKMPIPDYKKRRFFRTKTGKRVLLGLIIAWCLTLILPIGSLWDRTQVSSEGVTNYGLFGCEQEHRPLSAVKSTHVRIFYRHGKHHGWGINYTLLFQDGTKEVFDVGVDTLEATDALFEGIPKTVEGHDKIEKFLSPRTREKLHAILDKMVNIDE